MVKPSKRLKRLLKQVTFCPEDSHKTKSSAVAIKHYQGHIFWGTLNPRSSAINLIVPHLSDVEDDGNKRSDVPTPQQSNPTRQE